jgi:hypothetical protein
MSLQRLLRMSPGEIVCRSRQEATKRFERFLSSPRVNGWAGARAPDLRVEVSGGLRGAPSIAASPEALLEEFRTGGATGFFEGAAAEETSAVLERRFPALCERILGAAEETCGGRFDLLGYRGLSFGDPIDWHLDPLLRRRTPLAHWSEIDPLDPAQVGDSKVVWELNRHQWLLALAQACLLTGDERYAETSFRHMEAWMQANPIGFGINWTSSLEVGMRLMAWCWTLILLRGATCLSARRLRHMLACLVAHASHVERYLSYYFSPNTHLTGEALALFYAGVALPEMRGSKHWRALGARILTQELDRQVLPDGVHFEQSICYQRYTVEIYLHYLILAERNAVKVAAGVADRVQAMLDFLLAVRRPDGTLPAIGDSDGGALMPFVQREPGDCRALFSTAATWFRRADYAWAAGGLTPEALWLIGPRAGDTFDALQPAAPRAATLNRFPHGGYVVMRSGWDEHEQQLIFDVGPLGCPVSSGHGHADLLSIQCSAFGESILIDPGTCCYTPDMRWRDYFRGTAAHNTVTVDGRWQAAPAGPFGWQTRPRARLRRWLTTDSFDLADADHDAYDSLPDPVKHRRRVFYVKPEFWIVVDDLYGTALHQIELRFQFAPMKVTMSPGPWFRIHGSEGRGLLLRAFSAVMLETVLEQGEHYPIQGWVAPDYGRRVPAPVLKYIAVARLPLRIVTLLIPFRTASQRTPAVTAQIENQVIGLIFEHMGETVRIGEQEILRERH